MAEASSIKPNEICDITSCSICLEMFKEPKVLPCIHTFCHQCLDTYCESKKHDQEVSCPLCRTVFTIPSGGIKDLPNNFFIQQLLAVNKSSVTTGAQESDKPTFCELCSDDSELEVAATSYCIECDQHICDRCSGIHKKIKFSKSHQVVHNNDFSCSLDRAKWLVSYCDEHPCEQNRVFCYDCRAILCTMCLSKHKLHKCSDIREAAEVSRVQLNEDINSLSTCVLHQQEQLVELNLSTERFLTKVVSAHSEISLKYDTLISLIQAQKNQLAKELNQFKDDIMKKMETRKEEIERQRVIAESFMRYCQEMMNKGGACELSRTSHVLHARTEELVNTQDEFDGYTLSEVEITFKPSLSLTDYVNNFIGELVFRGDANTTLEDEINEPISLTTFLAKPTLLHVMPMIKEPVSGITILGGEVFVVPLTSLVYVYDADDFTLTRTLLITGSRELRGLVSCSHYNCLYASDYHQQCYYRYDLHSNVTTNWSTGAYCYRLSVTSSYTVLAMLYGCKEIHEYTTHGILIGDTSVDYSLDGPKYCVRLSTDNLAVCHLGEDHQRVSIVDEEGRIIHSYGGSPGSRVGQLNRPYHLTVDAHDNVLVADSGNNRVQLLSPTLSYLGDVVISEHQLNDPCTLYFDEHNCRLYIGEWVGGRVFVLAA